MILEEPFIEIHRAFSQGWWKDVFLKETNHLEKTSVFEDCINPIDINILKKEVGNTINTICKLRTQEHGFRIWEEGGLIPGDRMNQFYNHPIEQGEAIEDWALRFFEDKKFGIILNAAEVLNPKLAKEIADKMLPYFEVNGTPLRGYNITLFIGNYGFTPLGVHKDPPGESVIHFHLGPAKKTIYQWNNEELDGEMREHRLSLREDVERLLPLARPYHFKEGDIYFMTSKNYHIGETNELSIGIALWSNKNFKEELSKELLRTIKEKYVPDVTVGGEGFNVLEEIENSYSLFDIPQNRRHLSFKGLCLDEYKQYRYSLLSNGGFLNAPLERDEKYNVLKEEDSFVLETPFRIESYVSDFNANVFMVYVRGHQIVLESNRVYEDILKSINTGEVLSVKSITSLSNDKITKDTIISLLNDFLKYHGIKKL